MPYTHFLSPVGMVKITSTDGKITTVSFEDEQNSVSPKQHPATVLKAAVNQLQRYFKRHLTTFNLPLALHGTTFQKNVWKTLQEIPYGTTISYMGLAEKLGDPNAVRAVGRANGKNPIPIIIPCHRVIGSDGSLIGYGGGIEHKRRLLQHEGAILL